MLVLNNKIQFQSQRAMIGSSRGEERGYDSLFLHTVLCFCDFVAVQLCQTLSESCGTLQNMFLTKL